LILENCEMLWDKNFPLKNKFVVQTIPIRLNLAIKEEKVLDIRRCYRMKEALLLFDFNDPLIEDLKKIIFRATYSFHFLKTSYGRRYLSFIFSVIHQLIPGLICIIKNQLPNGRKSLATLYGNVLFRSWKWSTGKCKLMLDEALQFFTYAALYAANSGLHIRLLILLEQFNKNRTNKDLRSILYRCYDPLLINSLSAQNAFVRKNALSLLDETYPVQDPNCTPINSKLNLEAQNNMLLRLLRDCCPDIRAKSVEVITRLCLKFWPLLRADLVCKIFAIIANDLVFDSQSILCRIKSIMAIGALMRRPEIKPLFKSFIKRLNLILKDSNEMARVAFASILYCVSCELKSYIHNFVNSKLCIKSLTMDTISVASIFHRIMIPRILDNSKNIGEYKSFKNFIRTNPEAGKIFCKLLRTEAKILNYENHRIVPGLTVSQAFLLAHSLINHLISYHPNHYAVNGNMKFQHDKNKYQLSISNKKVSYETSKNWSSLMNSMIELVFAILLRIDKDEKANCLVGYLNDVTKISELLINCPTEESRSELIVLHYKCLDTKKKLKKSIMVISAVKRVESASKIKNIKQLNTTIIFMNEAFSCLKAISCAKNERKKLIKNIIYAFNGKSRMKKKSSTILLFMGLENSIVLQNILSYSIELIKAISIMKENERSFLLNASCVIRIEILVNIRLKISPLIYSSALRRMSDSSQEAYQLFLLLMSDVANIRFDLSTTTCIEILSKLSYSSRRSYIPLLVELCRFLQLIYPILSATFKGTGVLGSRYLKKTVFFIESLISISKKSMSIEAIIIQLFQKNAESISNRWVQKIF
jgi:hypothetical protein